MFHHVRPRAAVTTAIVAAALAVVPSASSGNYADPSGDAVGGAGDITSVTVAGDKGTGQLVFRVAGTSTTRATTSPAGTGRTGSTRRARRSGSRVTRA